MHEVLWIFRLHDTSAKWDAGRPTFRDLLYFGENVLVGCRAWATCNQDRRKRHDAVRFKLYVRRLDCKL
jgi:hypothetical protein